MVSNHITDILNQTARDILDEIIKATNPLPSSREITDNLYICISHITTTVGDLYDKLLTEKEAEVLDLPEGSSKARVTVAMEDLAKDLGGEKAANDELNRRLDEIYPPTKKMTTEEDILTNIPDKSILN